MPETYTLRNHAKGATIHHTCPCVVCFHYQEVWYMRQWMITPLTLSPSMPGPEDQEVKEIGDWKQLCLHRNPGAQVQGRKKSKTNNIPQQTKGYSFSAAQHSLFHAVEPNTYPRNTESQRYSSVLDAFYNKDVGPSKPKETLSRLSVDNCQFLWPKRFPASIGVTRRWAF